VHAVCIGVTTTQGRTLADFMWCFFFPKQKQKQGQSISTTRTWRIRATIECLIFLFSPLLLLLPEMWDLSDANKNGALNQDGFDLLLRLIAQCQSGQVMPTLLAVCCFNTTLFGVYYCCYLSWYCFCHPYFVGVTMFLSVVDNGVFQCCCYSLCQVQTY
jgi:hypothetical protein